MRLIATTTTTQQPAAEQVVDAVRDVGSAGVPWLWVAVIVLAALVVERILRLVAGWWWGRRRSVTDPRDLERSKVQRTRLSVIRSVITYTVSGAALIAIVIVLSEGSVPAALSVSVLVIIVGWGLNRVFADMIAGALLLFERQYRVGDYIILPDNEVGGVVEEFALRTTVLRSLNGDRITVLNGSIHEIVKVQDGYRDFEIELFVPSDRIDQARVRVERVCARMRAYHQNLFLKGPVPVAATSLEGRRVSHLQIRAVVPPSLEWLAEDILPAQLRDAMGDMIVGPVQVFNLDTETFNRYLNDVILPRFQELERQDTGEIPLVDETGSIPVTVVPDPG